jgi:predicted DNA binding protein
MITTHDATILDAYGRRDRWKLRVMYPDRDELSAINDFCNSHGLSFSVESVREMEGEPAGRYGLTTEQFEALTAAAERGLFEVPRGVTIEQLAEAFDISHQAMSERIRRATGALVEDTLLIGMAADA